ncbi:PH domain-containing protein [Myroides sp. DW712]|uniref:PH domain-containing protein n=1 Tax=Myroides sp. DW712 TaxID=3389800 RepID=UPI00397D2E01
MKKFPAKKKGFFIYPLFASLIPLIILYTHEGSLLDIAFELILSLLPVLLLVWVYSTTVYGIEGHFFHYRSAFIKGKIDILTITRLEIGKSLWVGTKPALARKGIIITYNRFDEIYVAPLSNSELVKELVAIHPAIEVVYHEKK